MTSLSGTVARKRATTDERPTTADKSSGVASAQSPPLYSRGIAAVALILLAMRITLPQGVEVGFVVAALLAPLWLRTVRYYRFMPLLLIVGTLAAGAGIWLRIANRGDHAVDSGIATSTTILLIGAVLSIGLVLWARTVLSLPMVALFFGVGLLLGVDPSAAQFATNPYKFGFALPLAVIGLALAKLSRRWWVELLGVVALIGLAATHDARSTFGLLLLAVVLLVAQIPFFRAGHGGSAFLVSLGVVVVGIIVYNVGQALVLSGLLGESTTQRSLAQFDASGSVLLGGRPELGATLALMRHTPWGFGAGTAPNPSDIRVAQEGMAAIGYDPNNGYVTRFMFGGHFELHSVFGDLWAQTGVAGLLFIAVAALAMVYGVTRNIADGTAAAILLYVVAKSMFDLLFSPFFSAEQLFVLALGLVAVPVAQGAFRTDRGQRAYSRTSSMGPSKRAFGWKPALSRAASSKAADSRA
ncbi:hypothetical protein [Frondihabitans sp. Leaf304]|uniref:hypothetical protein n=1 Tax=Frondihabitans sp. Leaf304 TaxID=1736329 RepID=UPI0012FB3D68|nr:hypothetical protein [Frondihabitans sp. Leaf304]